MADQLNIISNLSLLKSRDKVTLECLKCKSHFLKNKNKVLAYVKNYHNHNIINYDYRFCCQKCRSLYLGYLVETVCKQCNKPILKVKSEYKKSNLSFCSHSCSAIYSNSHKTTGTRRSKLEFWLETNLKSIYPALEIFYNDTKTIGVELDIFIPSLKIAFELNGPFHYEPIYGLEKLNNTQKRDKQKTLTCANNGIELCVIDTSKQKYFKEKTSQEFLKIITCIIDKLESNRGAAPRN